MLLKPLRTSLSMPRMPRTSIEPSMVAETLRSWICRCCATAATPAVRQPPSATSANSTGVAPLSSEAKISGWSTSYVYRVRCFCSSPSPKKPSTVELLCVPFFHSVVARHWNSAAAGAAVSASRAPRSASTLTPLSTGVSSTVIALLPHWTIFWAAQWRTYSGTEHRTNDQKLSVVGDRAADSHLSSRFRVEGRTQLGVGLHAEG